MIVDRSAAKKSFAVTLALALGLSLPGGTAWSQMYNGAASAVTPVAGAPAAAAAAGAQTAGSAVPSLSPSALNLSAPAILSAPAASPAALAATPAASAASPAAAPAARAAAAAPSAAIAAPAKASDLSPSGSRAQTAAIAAPGSAATPKAAPASRADLDAVSGIAGKSADQAGAVEVVSMGRFFDGYRAPASDVRAMPLEAPQDGSTGRRIHLAPASAPKGAPTTATQKRMLASLYQVASIFAEQYAPLDFKKERFHLDLKREYDAAKAAILADPAITTRGYQDILAKLVASMRDYHVSISFNSTESSKLPFQVAGAEGRYYLTHIDREKLPKEVFPFQMGDEVVALDGRTTADAVKAIAGAMTSNTAQTDMRMAELFLTNRRRARGDTDIPKGTAEVVIRSKGKFYKVRMPWDYTPELVPQDVPLRNAGLLEPEGLGGAPAAAPSSLIHSVGEAFSNAVHPLIDLFSDIRAEAADDNAFMIGSRKSFVPRLGQVLWRTGDDSHFDAYIFKDKSGRKMGYIRIAAYDGDYKEVQEFAKIAEKFQAEVEGLVIDQVNNPGGSVFYLYALASHLTGKPLTTPHHRLIVGEADAQQSAELLLKVLRDSKKPAAAQAKVKKLKADEEPPNAGGYPITAKFMNLMIRSAQFILKEFKSGKRLTDLIHISGVDDIDPAPKESERFTKPILLLTNALDFSGGDFFPAIMQDNQRATILGVRTAGAGGVVKPYAVSQFGIARLSATGSLAQRANGQPIENLGVTPDIPYEITAKDLRTGFAQYRWKILKALDAMLAAPKPAAPAP
jgi:hypothetical protein